MLRHVSERILEGEGIGRIASEGRNQLLLQATAQSEAAIISLPTDGDHQSDPAGPALARLCLDVVQAAVAINGNAIERGLDRAFASVIPSVAIRNVVEPAAIAIGDLWAGGECSEAGEHLAGRIFERRLMNLLDSERDLSAGEHVICACFPDELHLLGCLVRAYELALSSRNIHLLGAALPFSALERAVAELNPHAVHLSVSRSILYRTHRSDLRDLALRMPPELAIHVGGQGVPRSDPELEAAGVALLPTGRLAMGGRLPSGVHIPCASS